MIQKNIVKKNNIEHIQLIPANEKLEKLYSSYGFIITDKMQGIMTKSLSHIHIKRNKTRKIKKYNSPITYKITYKNENDNDNENNKIDNIDFNNI